MTKLITFWAIFALGCALGLMPLNAQKPAPKAKIEIVEVDRDFDETLHKKCLYPTIRVSNIDVSQKSSGFIVRSDRTVDEAGNVLFKNVVLTCGHCVSDEDTVYFADLAVYDKSGTTFQKWDRHPGAVYAASKQLDLAIFLFTSEASMPTVDLDFARRMCIGNNVFHIGCGMGEEPRYDVGYINSLSGRVGGHTTPVYRTSMQTLFGDSGGPAFYKYKVIGLMQAIKVTSFRGFPQMVPGVSMCIPIGTFKTWDDLENNTLRFIYNPEAELPRLPYAGLKFQHLDWEKIHEGE